MANDTATTNGPGCPGGDTGSSDHEARYEAQQGRDGRHSHLTAGAHAGSDVYAIMASAGPAQTSTSQIYIHGAKGLVDATAWKIPTLTRVATPLSS